MLQRSQGVRFAMILAMTGLGYAQQYSFRHYGAAEGLQNLAVLSLAQDGKGFIWAGAEGGLYRYDGTRFHLMGPAEGLPCASEVHALHVSADGALWANTCSQVFRFDGQRFHVVAGLDDMLFHAQAMADGPRGFVVVATNSGLKEILPAGGGFTARPYLPGAALANQKTRGVLRSGSQLWFGCGNLLCVAENGVVTEIGPAQGLPPGLWSGIGITPDGTVWVRSDAKLYRRAPGAQQFQPETFDLAPSMYWGALTTEPDGTVLVPTDKGLAIYRGGHWTVIDEWRGLRTS